MAKIFLFILITVFQTMDVAAQLTAKEKWLVVSIFDSVLKAKYVFPEISVKVGNELRKNLENGLYDTITSKDNFAFILNRDVRQIANDLHLKISHDEKIVSIKNDTTARKKTTIPFEDILKENKYGVKTKEILPGNIGYLDIPLFGPIDLCADTIIAAMDFVRNTDALIIDLRTCRGALDENTILFFLSYFFQEPVHLSDFYVYEENLTKQNWSYAWVPGRRYLDKPVYLVTSSRTFSGGEAFAYDLQQFKRARLVGETTRGGAHPTQFVRLNNSFTAGIPYARPINTLSKTNWEHTGVRPDSSVNTNIALYVAHLMAATELLSRSGDSVNRDRLTKDIRKIRQEKPEFRRLKFMLKGYPDAKEVAVVGSFNSYSRTNFLLKRSGSNWEGEADVLPGDVHYSFLVDGKWINDPENHATVKVNDFLYSTKVIK